MNRVTVLAVLAGAFGSLDTAVNIAFPALTEAFDLTVSGLRWVVIYYVLTYGLSLLIAGRLGDQRGHARTLALGGVVAGLGLGLCAAASSFDLFLAGRVVQGLGTALVMAAAPAMITLAAGEAQRGRAIGLFQTSAAVGLMVGPLLGGGLIKLTDWRSVFWFRVPMAATLVVLALAAAARVATQTAETASSPAPERRQQPAEAASTSGSSTGGSSGYGSGFLAANLMAVLVNAAMFATWLLVPILLVDELDYGLLASGALLAVSPAATAVASSLAGRWSDRGRTGLLVVGGAMCGAVGMGVLSQVGSQLGVEFTAESIVVVGLVLVGTGLGLFSVPNMATVMAAMPRHQQGLAAGLSLTTRTLGIVIGVISATILFNRLESSRIFVDAFEGVFLTMAVVLAVAGSLEGMRRVVSTP